MDFAAELLKLGPPGLICIVLLMGYLRETKKNDALVAYVKDITEKRIVETRETLKIIGDSTAALTRLETTIRESTKK